MKNYTSLFIAAVLVIAVMCAIPASGVVGPNARLLMTGYQIGDGITGTVDTGTFTLHYSLTNHSNSNAVGAVISFEQRGPFVNPVIIPVPGSPNSKYIGNIGAGDTYDGSFEMYVPRHVGPGIYRLDFTVNYGTPALPDTTLLSSSFSIFLSIDNTLELSMLNVQLFSEAASGGRMRLMVEYENPGARDFRNLRLVIDGNILEQQKIQTLPILRAGRRNTIEYYIQFTDTGYQRLGVHITYDDEEGNSFLTPVVTVTAEVPEETVSAPVQSVTEPGGFVSGVIERMIRVIRTPETIAIIIVLLAATAAAAVLISKARRRAARKKWYYKDRAGGGQP
jgi:hypothetical protein